MNEQTMKLTNFQKFIGLYLVMAIILFIGTSLTNYLVENYFNTKDSKMLILGIIILLSTLLMMILIFKKAKNINPWEN